MFGTKIARALVPEIPPVLISVKMTQTTGVDIINKAKHMHEFAAFEAKLDTFEV
ncbi:MAG: hypothetical protein MHM6MM_007532 [Cercozoa sp. M6MM]